jgi:hypothetical protein
MEEPTRNSEHRILNSMSWPFPKGADQRPSERRGPPQTFRACSELVEEERATRKRADLGVQRSELNPPDVRIRAWEKVHGLQLPSESAHPILDVIAMGTRLTLADVQAEQRARAGRLDLKPASGAGTTED